MYVFNLLIAKHDYHDLIRLINLTKSVIGN